MSHALQPRTVVAGAALGTLVLLVGEWSLVQPRVRANDDLRAKVDALRVENARTETMIAEYERFKREAEEVERQFAAALESVPSEAELAGALEDLEQVTKASGVNLVRFTPQPAPRPPIAKPATARPAAGKPAVVTAPPVALQARSITIALRGRFAEVRGLLERLAGYERLLTVEGLKLRTATLGPYTLEATVDLKCYYKRLQETEAREIARR
jgi:hypothetical protein